MEIKVYKLGNIDTTNEETINNSIRDEIKSINAGDIQIILEWDEEFEKNFSIAQKVRSISIAVHAALEYGYSNVFLMDPERNVYSLGIDIGVKLSMALDRN